MPTTVAEVLDDHKDKEAVARLSGLIVGVHANRLKPAQRTGSKGRPYWSAFLPVSIRDNNRTCDVNINWPVKDGQLELPPDIVKTGQQLLVIKGESSLGGTKDDGTRWPTSVWARLADVRLDGAETPPGAPNGAPPVATPAPGAAAAPAASQAQTRPSLPPKSQAAAVGFMVSAWDSLASSLGSAAPPPASADLADLVGVLTQAYLQGRIE